MSPGPDPPSSEPGEGADRDPRSPRTLAQFREQRGRDARRREARDRGYRRAWWAGLAVSAVVHAVLVVVLSSQLHLPQAGFRSAPAPRSTETQGLELVRVQPPEEVTTPPRPVREPPPAPQPEEEREPAEEEPAPEAEGEPTPAETEASGEAEEEAMSNAERLRPREGDSRVWREFWDEDADRYLGGTARADSAIRAILGKYFDSLRVAREAYDDARDWTVGEGDERWGVSPEGIHLGDVTIPIPVNQLLSPTGPKRRQLERELRQLRQIQRQETLREAEETREDRIEEMRERSREEAGSDSTDADGGG